MNGVPSYGERTQYTFPCVSLPGMNKTGAKLAGSTHLQRYTPWHELSQPPDCSAAPHGGINACGHTPQKLPRCRAISRIIAECAYLQTLDYCTTRLY